MFALPTDWGQATVVFLSHHLGPPTVMQSAHPWTGTRDGEATGTISIRVTALCENLLTAGDRNR